jgi:hypothetical protein
LQTTLEKDLPHLLEMSAVIVTQHLRNHGMVIMIAEEGNIHLLEELSEIEGTRMYEGEKDEQSRKIRGERSRLVAQEMLMKKKEKHKKRPRRI